MEELLVPGNRAGGTQGRITGNKVLPRLSGMILGQQKQILCIRRIAQGLAIKPF